MNEVDKDRLVALFVEYDRKDQVVEKKRKDLEKSIKDRSDTVKDILEANLGMKRIRRAGKEYSIVIRGETYFFRGGKGEGITEV